MDKGILVLFLLGLIGFVFAMPYFSITNTPFNFYRYIEASFYFASISLPFVGLLVLYQIKLMRDDLEYKKNSDKEKTAISLNGYFVNEIAASYRRIDKLFLEADLLYYEGCIGDFSYMELAKRSIEGGNMYHKYMDVWLTDKGEEIYSEVGNFIIMLDNYAYHIINDLADKRLCYLRSGGAYCSLVKKFYPYIVYHLSFSNEDPATKNESYLQDLYFLWEPKVVENLEEAKESK